MTHSDTDHDRNLAASPVPLRAATSRHLGRRTILHGAAWSIPAVYLTVGTPALASSGTVSLSLSAPGMSIPAAGPCVLTATATAAGGTPASGLSTTVNVPGTSYTGVTDGSGIYAPTVDLGNTWAPGGSTTTVSAIAGSASASVGLTVLGANALGWGQSAPMSGTDAASSVPVQMSRVFPAPIVQSRAGGSFSTNWFHVTLLADGSVWTRGTNGRGQLGDGTTTDRALTFAKVPGVSDVVQVATGSGFVMALRSDGRVYVWGSNNRGQLGLGDATDRLSPVLSGLTGVTQVVAGGFVSFALLSDGTIRSCGAGDLGQLGDGTVRGASEVVSTPVTVSGISSATSISCGAGYVVGMALLTDGSVWTWGDNRGGGVGNGTTTVAPTPAPVSGLSNVTKVVGGAHSVYALLGDKTVKAWGLNAEGQLGNGTTTASSVPVAMSNLTDVVKIASSWGAFYALRSNGTVSACGWNGQGLVGDGTTTNRTTVVPVSVPAGLTVTDIGGNAGGGSGNFIVTR